MRLALIPLILTAAHTFVACDDNPSPTGARPTRDTVGDTRNDTSDDPETADADAPEPCEADARRCSADTVEVCAEGRYFAVETCADDRVCDAGYCVAPPPCSEGLVQCHGDDLAQCRDAAWTTLATCVFGCDDAACNGEPPLCVQDAVACDGDDVVRCQDEAWVVLASCAHGCDDGMCGAAPVECIGGGLACRGDDLVACQAGSWVMLARCDDGCDPSAAACVVEVAPPPTATCDETLSCALAADCDWADDAPDACTDACRAEAAPAALARFDDVVACAADCFGGLECFLETCALERAWCYYPDTGFDTCEEINDCAVRCDSSGCIDNCARQGTRSAQADFLWYSECMGHNADHCTTSTCELEVMLDECYAAYVNCVP